MDGYSSCDCCRKGKCSGIDFTILGYAGNTGTDTNTSEKNEHNDEKKHYNTNFIKQY